MNEFFKACLHDVGIINILYTPIAVAMTAIALIIIMTSVYDNQVNIAKEWIKNIWLAWCILCLAPSFLAIAYNWAMVGGVGTWKTSEVWDQDTNFLNNYKDDLENIWNVEEDEEP